MKIGTGCSLLLIVFGNFCYASLNCGIQTPRSELDNNRNPYPGQFPWLVRLFVYYDNQNTTEEICGGSLISDRLVLTSGYCIKKDDKIHQVDITKIEVHLGKVGVGKNDGSVYFANKIIRHPCIHNFGGDWNFDFVLIQLSSVVKFNSNIQPICLPQHCDGQNFDPFKPAIDNCKQALIAGWEGNETNLKFEFGKLEISPQGVCTERYRGHTGLKMCVKDMTARCFEDNGGPVMCMGSDSTYFQIGIFSNEFCKYEFQTYPRICVVLPWINAVMSGNEKYKCQDQWKELENSVDDGNFQCGIPFPRPPNKGEYEPYAGQYPWLAQIYVTNLFGKVSKICIGSLISEQWILMSASCLLDDDGKVAKSLAIILGRFDFSTHYSIDKPMITFSYNIHIHPLWSHDGLENSKVSDRRFDFALVKLRIRISPNSTRIRPICLPSHCDENLDVESQAIDHCESTEYTDWTNSGLIPDRNSSLLTHSKCNDIYEGRLRHSEICSNGEMSICNYALFPLMCKNNSHSNIFILGANGWASKGYGCGEGQPIFGRVCSALPWIKEVMNRREVTQFPPFVDPTELHSPSFPPETGPKPTKGITKTSTKASASTLSQFKPFDDIFKLALTFAINRIIKM